MDRRSVKQGEVKRLHKPLVGSKWKSGRVILYTDSCLTWYDKRVSGSSRPAGSVMLKNVAPYISLFMDIKLVRRPNIPDGYSMHHLVAIAMDALADVVHWFLFSSDTDLEAWFVEIVKTLPKPQSPTGCHSNNNCHVPLGFERLQTNTGKDGTGYANGGFLAGLLMGYDLGGAFDHGQFNGGSSIFYALPELNGISQTALVQEATTAAQINASDNDVENDSSGLDSYIDDLLQSDDIDGGILDAALDVLGI
uniref:PH domain-containing protein n=1 Tax=Steinernema glaseri TaxID=37863 RepID=A0A1I7YSZ8_9BILA